jgi:ribosomal protein S18 acetylase RimI-like enzyme
MDIAMQLVAAAEKDLDQILQLQKKAFHGQALIYNDFSLPSLTQTLDDLKRESASKDIYMMVLEGKIVASVRCFVKDRTLSIEKLIVDPDLQNQGIGSRVMREIECRYAASVDRYELSTGHKSERNLHLYKKLGYHEIRRERLNNNCDLMVMEKDKAHEVSTSVDPAAEPLR